MVDKLRFRAKVARSSELVCIDRVRIVCGYFTGIFLQSPPPTRGAPTLHFLELFTFKHARTYCYAHSDSSTVFARARSLMNSKLVIAIPDVFAARLPAPQRKLRRIFTGSRWPPIFVDGACMLVKLRFRPGEITIIYRSRYDTLVDR